MPRVTYASNDSGAVGTVGPRESCDSGGREGVCDSACIVTVGCVRPGTRATVWPVRQWVPCVSNLLGTVRGVTVRGPCCNWARVATVPS